MTIQKVCGIGIKGNISTRDMNGNILKSYSTWQGMLRRCYDSKFHKTRPNYINCTVDSEWLSYETFKKWFDIHYREDYQLDKDVLVKNNLLYSPNTCCFIPKEINSLIKSSNKSRGKYPIGVTYNNYTKKYCTTISKRGLHEYIGCFDTSIEAFNAYKTKREAYVKEIATQYFCEGRITWSVRNALHEFTVEIDT